MRTINKIYIHCTANSVDSNGQSKLTVNDIDKFHRSKGWQCCGYHLVVTTKGEIQRGRADEMIGAGVTGDNSNSLHLAYIGGLDVKGKNADTRNKEQKEAICKAVSEWMKKYNIPITNVFGHYQAASAKKVGKTCPNFKIEDFRKELEEYIKGNKCPLCGK